MWVASTVTLSIIELVFFQEHSKTDRQTKTKQNKTAHHFIERKTDLECPKLVSTTVHTRFLGEYIVARVP